MKKTGTKDTELRTGEPVGTPSAMNWETEGKAVTDYVINIL